MNRLSDFTTLRLGGPAHDVVDCTDTEALVGAVRRCDAEGRPFLVLGGGSNLVVADDGFAGTVLRVLTRGMEQRWTEDRVTLTVQAGEPWDRLVDRSVEAGWAGFECLAGIPGSTGATPIQNVGAYGSEVAHTIVQVVAYDREARQTRSLSPAECQFSYRTSRFKNQNGRWIVLEVAFSLTKRETSNPIRYFELARHLGVSVGESAPLRRVRDAVLSLRQAKGMVLRPGDPDTVSAGSFFLNPILTVAEWEDLRARIHVRFGSDVEPPVFPGDDGKLKSSAAWLIEHAGFYRGYGSPHGIAISGKHTLALTNRGRGTTTELVALAREITDKVWQEFGIELKPEPVFVVSG